jgi:ferredoxin--NADP+ reductase
VYRIADKQALSAKTRLMVIHAPHVARKAEAGQFVIVKINEYGERIPLTIADYDRNSGAITVIFQEVGKSTMCLGTLNAGDEIATCAGPLGHPTEIKKYGTVICVGGGVGIAPIYPIARSLKEAGNTVISITGARNKDFLFWTDRVRSVSDELFTCTDDGSYERKGLVTGPLKELLDARADEISRVWAIGPGAMMKSVSMTTKPFKIKTIVSLNTIMIDGTGMCGGCRVLLEDGAQFVCVDGPEFDGHKVDWDSLLSRMQFYCDEEHAAVKAWEHKCNLDAVIDDKGR